MSASAYLAHFMPGAPPAPTASWGLHEAAPLPCMTQGKLLNLGATSRGKFGCKSSGHSDPGCSRELSLVQGWLPRSRLHNSGPWGRHTDPRGFGNSAGNFLFLLLSALVHPALPWGHSSAEEPPSPRHCSGHVAQFSNCRLPGAMRGIHRSCPGQAANG